MISIKHIEMKEILKRFKEEVAGEVAFRVTDKSVQLNVTFDDFDERNDAGFSTAHFCELNGNPLTVQRRWDVMKFYPSHADICNELQHGRARMIERIVRNVINHHPRNEVIVLLAIPSKKKAPSQKDVNDYLCGLDEYNKDVVNALNQFNEDDILEYISVDPERTYSENQNHLLTRIMNLGMQYNSGNEWFPRQFVLITPCINWYTDYESKIMQTLLAKGIRMVELHDTVEVENGKVAVNRDHEFGLLYFPTDDYYLSNSGVQYKNYYVRSRISSEELDFNAYKVIHIPVVVENADEYPMMPAQQIVYAIQDQCFSQKNYNRSYDFNYVFASSKNIKYAVGNNPGYDLDMVYGVPRQIEEAVTSNNVDKYLTNPREVPSYNYFIYFVPKDMMPIPKEEIAKLGQKLAGCNYHLIVMYEVEPKQGSEIESIQQMIHMMK